MNTTNNIIINLDVDIENHLTDIELERYIQWYFPELKNNCDIIKKLKVMLFNAEFIDTMLYDLDLSYYELIVIICRLYPSVVTPAIIRNIKNAYDEFKLLGVDDQ
jgi:hypothetical protein